VLLAIALSPRLPVGLAHVPLVGRLVAAGASGAVALAISQWPARHVVQASCFDGASPRLKMPSRFRTGRSRRGTRSGT
jgi:hypothetical protein